MVGPSLNADIEGNHFGVHVSVSFMPWINEPEATLNVINPGLTRAWYPQCWGAGFIPKIWPWTQNLWHVKQIWGEGQNDRAIITCLSFGDGHGYGTPTAKFTYSGGWCHCPLSHSFSLSVYHPPPLVSVSLSVSAPICLPISLFLLLSLSHSLLKFPSVSLSFSIFLVSFPLSPSLSISQSCSFSLPSLSISRSSSLYLSISVSSLPSLSPVLNLSTPLCLSPSYTIILSLSFFSSIILCPPTLYLSPSFPLSSCVIPPSFSLSSYPLHTFCVKHVRVTCKQLPFLLLSQIQWI